MPINKQPPEKAYRNGAGEIEVHSIFHTIQGEGIYAGEPAIFIRLAGCNLQCPQCDTDYTSFRKLMNVAEILMEVAEQKGLGPTDLIVITGGEPFRQELGHLVKMLYRYGFTIQIETNGTLYDADFPYQYATIICSPKTGKVASGLLPYISAYKYVISAGQVSPEDGLPLRALDHPSKPQLARPHKGFPGVVYVQPIDVQDTEENARHLSAAIDSCIGNGYRLCLQLHKIIGME